MDAVLLIGLIFASYLIGSVSFGRILSARQKVDVTTQGSGNTGATNMLRTYGAKLGFLTLLFDLIKGVVPALVGFFAFGGVGAMPDSYIGLYACGLSAVIGHIFPIYYRFKGGKAAATAFGVFLVAQPVIALCSFLLCFGLAIVFKYVSPMSLLFIVINVIWQCFFMPEFTPVASASVAVVLLVVALGVAVWCAHWKNIVRLVKGVENKTDIWGKITEKLKKNKTENNPETKSIDTENGEK
ncbi:MAG: glycerol-3-phosphate 1-O-acyltransferase PlsY [Clostridia bacterium]|nr:glycerol-3-phosphate 1-O-acyltransferase PlsY [Clostridia bacterium]